IKIKLAHVAVKLELVFPDFGIISRRGQAGLCDFERFLVLSSLVVRPCQTRIAAAAVRRFTDDIRPEARLVSPYVIPHDSTDHQGNEYCGASDCGFFPGAPPLKRNEYRLHRYGK